MQVHSTQHGRRVVVGGMQSPVGKGCAQPGWLMVLGIKVCDYDVQFIHYVCVFARCFSNKTISKTCLNCVCVVARCFFNKTISKTCLNCVCVVMHCQCGGTPTPWALSLTWLCEGVIVTMLWLEWVRVGAACTTHRQPDHVCSWSHWCMPPPFFFRVCR